MESLGFSKEALVKLRNNRTNIEALDQRALALRDLAKAATSPKEKQAVQEALEDFAVQQQKVFDEIFGKEIDDLLKRPDGLARLHLVFRNEFPAREGAYLTGGISPNDLLLLREHIKTLITPVGKRQVP